MSVERDFAVAVLQRSGVPVTPASMRNMLGWMRAEGGHTHNAARWNFLNTTQPMPGAGNTGSQGNIKVYRDFGQGVDATVRTLRNGRYGNILRSFNASPEQFAAAVGSSPWGTGGASLASIIRQTPAPGGAMPAGRPAYPQAGPAATPPPPAGQLDTAKLMALLAATRQRVLAGQMPGPGYQRQLVALAAGAYPRAQTVNAVRTVGSQAIAAAGAVGGLTMGGGPADHHARALGNWQSDNAYDLMGKAGQAVYAPVGGQVIKISGGPGGRPQFAGYGITVRTPQGDLFFKHLGSSAVRVGGAIRPGQLIGTLEPTTLGGPHLHLGGTNLRELAALARLLTGRR